MPSWLHHPRPVARRVPLSANFWIAGSRNCEHPSASFELSIIEPPVSPYFRPIHASRVYHRTLSSSPPSLRNNFITRICSLREEISKKVQASPLSFSRLQQLQFYFLSRDLPSIVKFISWRKKLLIRRKYRKILRGICIDSVGMEKREESKNRIGEDSRIAWRWMVAIDEEGIKC